MFSETAAYHDLIYGKFKDFREEASCVTAILKEVEPGRFWVLAKTLLLDGVYAREEVGASNRDRCITIPRCDFIRG